MTSPAPLPAMVTVTWRSLSKGGKARTIPYTRQYLKPIILKLSFAALVKVCKLALRYNG